MSTLGERIKEAREAASLSQVDLAELLELPSSKVISTWENDKNKPDIQKLRRMCKLLNIPYEFLFDAEEDTPYTNEDLEFFVNYSALDDLGKWIVKYNLEIQAARCTGGKTISESNGDKSEQSLFLSKDNPEYRKIKKQIPDLLQLKKKTGYSYENILFGLFSKGYVGKISILLLFQIFRGIKIPCQMLYDNIKNIMLESLI